MLLELWFRRNCNAGVHVRYFPEPTTTWQHCLDEGTQHYYYWNTTTNEVTWEIPDEYSKYLLLLKEYEERLTKYEETMKEWEERKKEPKKK